MKRFISIVLAFFILGTNLGFSFGVHYCGGRIAESKLLLANHNLGCGMETEVNTCEESSLPKISKVPCCKNEVKSIQLEEKTELTSKQVQLNKSIALISIVGLAIIDETINLDFYTDLSIPDKPKPDFQVLFQSFLL